MEQVNANNKKTSRKEATKTDSGSKDNVESPVRSQDAEGQERLLTRIGDLVFYRKGDRVCPAQVLEFRNGKAMLSITDGNTPVKPISIEKNVECGFKSGEFSKDLDELLAFIGIENASAS